ncbi:MAG: ATP-binding cassette domain-containing protein [Gammaproteobacteria bacterium]
MRTQPPAKKHFSGYGLGTVDTVLSVDEVAQEAQNIAGQKPTQKALFELAAGTPFIRIEQLVAGYGRLEILHGIDLYIGKGQSLCLIGPNGAGKSSVLHALYGFTNITQGRIVVNDADVTNLSPKDKLKTAGIAYILQENAVFPDMTVEENLYLGGFLLNDRHRVQEATERVFEKYPRLRERRRQRASVLSGGERRLLEISRALIMDPKVLLVDEPSIGLEPRFIDLVFDRLRELQQQDNKTIILVEQNAKKGLQFSDIGCVLVSGHVAMADRSEVLLDNPDIGRLFLGG